MSGMRSHSVILHHKVSGESVIDMIQKEVLKEKSLRLSEQNVSDLDAVCSKVCCRLLVL